MKYSYAVLLFLLLASEQALAFLAPPEHPSGTIKVKVVGATGSNAVAWARKGPQTFVAPLEKGIGILEHVPEGDWQVGVYGWTLAKPVSARVTAKKTAVTKVELCAKAPVSGATVEVRLTTSLSRVSVTIRQGAVTITGVGGHVLFPDIGKGPWQVEVTAPGALLMLAGDQEVIIACQREVTLRLRITSMILL